MYVYILYIYIYIGIYIYIHIHIHIHIHVYVTCAWLQERALARGDARYPRGGTGAAFRANFGVPGSLCCDAARSPRSAFYTTDPTRGNQA